MPTEPTGERPTPTPPDDLDGEALLEWERVCNELAAAGHLDKSHRAMLTLYVRTWAVHQANAVAVAKQGAVVKFPNGVVGQSPFYKTMRETAAQLRGLLADMGLTPATSKKGRTSLPAAGGELEF